MKHFTCEACGHHQKEVTRDDIAEVAAKIREKCRDLGIGIRWDDSLSTAEVSDVTDIPESTLRNYRSDIGNGPPFWKQEDNGWIRYYIEPLANWLLSR